MERDGGYEWGKVEEWSKRGSYRWQKGVLQVGDLQVGEAAHGNLAGSGHELEQPCPHLLLRPNVHPPTN